MYKLTPEERQELRQARLDVPRWKWETSFSLWDNIRIYFHGWRYRFSRRSRAMRKSNIAMIKMNHAINHCLPPVPKKKNGPANAVSHERPDGSE